MIGKEFYENYIVYPNGVIYNINSKKELTQRIVNKYKVVTLFLNKKRKDFKVHRLVALCFINNLENKPFINHIDGDKFNNNWSNLEWCTHLENIKHAIENNLMNSIGELNPSSKLKNEDVKNIRDLYVTNEYSHRKLAKKFGVSKTQITRILNNKSWNKCYMCHLAGEKHKMSCKSKKVTVFYDQMEKEVHQNNSNLNQ